MSIVKSYRDQFNIYIYDQDFGRCEKLSEVLRQAGYRFGAFTTEEALITAAQQQLPHVVVLFYQPLNVGFRKLLKTIRNISAEIEVVVLGSADFWPGVKNLLDGGLVTDYWAWPFASRDCLRLRVDQFVEKTIYRYISEQRSPETQEIIKKIDAANDMAKINFAEPKSSFDIYQLPGSVKSESRLIDDLVANLKNDYQDYEFAYLRYYLPKEQLLVYKTSFSAEGYTRGQFFSYPQATFIRDRQESYANLHTTISELFVTEDYRLLPVEFADTLYGFLIGFHVKSEAYPMLEKAVRYVALTMRNLELEKTQHDPHKAEQFQKTIATRGFFEAISREISRARRIRLPVTLLLAHLDFAGEQEAAMAKVIKTIDSSIRVYDFFCKTAENEIAIVLPHTNHQLGAIKAERLRRAFLADAQLTQNPPVRLCFGVAEFPSLAHGTDDLMEGAKFACDQVLAAGKNKVCLYTQAEGFEPEFRI